MDLRLCMGVEFIIELLLNRKSKEIEALKAMANSDDKPHSRALNVLLLKKKKSRLPTISNHTNLRRCIRTSGIRFWEAISQASFQ